MIFRSLFLSKFPCWESKNIDVAMHSGYRCFILSQKLIQISSFCSNYSTRIGIKKETDNRRWNSFMIGRYFITVNHFYHTILESGSNYSMPRVWNSIDRWFKERYARKGLYMDYIWAIYGLYMDYIWTIYGTIYGPFSKKSSEKDLNVRISLRTKAQSIYENFFTIP